MMLMENVENEQVSHTPSVKIPALLNAEPESELQNPPNQKGRKIARPRNSFIIYRQERGKELLAQGYTNLECSKKIAADWRNEPQEIRDIYIEKAQKEKEEHAVKYPNYVFQRRRTQDIKRRNRGKPMNV